MTSKLDPGLLKVLLPFQKEGIVAGLRFQGRTLLADEMGVGKTAQAIALAACYQASWNVGRSSLTKLESANGHDPAIHFRQCTGRVARPDRHPSKLATRLGRGAGALAAPAATSEHSFN